MNTANLLIPVIYYDVNNCIYPDNRQTLIHLAFLEHNINIGQVHSHLTHFPLLLFSLLLLLSRPSDFRPTPLCHFLLFPPFPRPFLPFSFFIGSLTEYATTAKANHSTVAFCKHRKEAPVSYTPYGHPHPPILGAYHGPGLSPVQVWRSCRKRLELSR